jgi:hypothetical protein
MTPRVAPTRRHRALHSPAVFKRQFAILPFDLPRLSDKAAAQLLDVLHQILEGIEYHYADQAHHHRKRQHESADTRHAPTSNPTDPPF